MRGNSVVSPCPARIRSLAARTRNQWAQPAKTDEHVWPNLDAAFQCDRTIAGRRRPAKRAPHGCFRAVFRNGAGGREASAAPGRGRKIRDSGEIPPPFPWLLGSVAFWLGARCLRKFRAGRQSPVRFSPYAQTAWPPQGAAVICHTHSSAFAVAPGTAALSFPAQYSFQPHSRLRVFHRAVSRICYIPLGRKDPAAMAPALDETGLRGFTKRARDRRRGENGTASRLRLLTQSRNCGINAVIAASGQSVKSSSGHIGAHCNV